jgi:single-strand DNA-binding protein
MSRGLNKVQIIGNLGRDPEMKYTPGGQAVTAFSIAIARRQRGRDGKTEEQTDWFRVVCWEKLAEIADQYLKKGARVYVEGRLQTRKFTGRDGVEKSATEIVAHDMILLSGQEKAAQPAAASRKSDKAWTPEREFFGDDDDLPF